MPRPKKDLDAWRTNIEQRIIQGQTHQEILIWLAGKGISVSRGTLRAILRQWGTQSDRSRLLNSSQNASLPTAVHDLWSQRRLTDIQIAETLTARGIALSTRQVQSIRLRHSIYRRNNDPETQAAAFIETQAAC